MNKIHIQKIKYKVGELIIGSFDNKICLCDWSYRKMRNQIDARIQKGLNAEYVTKSSEIIGATVIQLKEYFESIRIKFDIPLKLVGTDFQISVWEKLRTIPFGKTLTYKELAIRLGDEKAIRAVATANGTNAISIIVPCHRIIGTDNKLVGYAGGLSAKKKLLELEGAYNQQLKLF